MLTARLRRLGWRLVRSARTLVAVAVAMLLAISCAASAEVTDSPDPTARPAATVPQAESTLTAVPLTAVPPPESTPPESTPPESTPPESTPPESTPPTAVPTAQGPSESPAASSIPSPTATATPSTAPLTGTPTAAATSSPASTPTKSPEVVHVDRWDARKLLVDLDDASVAREIAALEAQRASHQVLVIAKDTSCGVLDTYAMPMPDGVVVEIFFDARVQCVRAIESTALFLIDAAGTNSHGSWNYRSAPSVRVFRTGVEERPTLVPTRPGTSPTATVERVTAGTLDAGIVATTVLTDPRPGDADDVLAALRASNSSGAVIVVANFQGCVLIGARAIAMPTQVVVRATFDANVDCFRAFAYQAFFVIESSGINSHGAWNYGQQPKVTVEYIDQS